MGYSTLSLVPFGQLDEPIEVRSYYISNLTTLINRKLTKENLNFSRGRYSKNSVRPTFDLHRGYSMTSLVQFGPNQK